eukprot:Hpha_TRINITY_DN14949_c3_g2::TRINITY_DN14949_c3_g2_i1::g.144174::m.144174
MGGDVADRLRHQGENKKMTVEEQRRRRDEAESAACSFRPRVNRANWTERVVPRYLDSPNRHQSESPRRRARTPDGCTFRPRINARFRHDATRDYVETDAFERLSRPTTPTRGIRHADRWRTPQSRTDETESVDKLRQQEEGFFVRLREQADKKANRMQELTAVYHGEAFEPDLNPHSRELIERRGRPDFWYRQEEFSQRRRHRIDGRDVSQEPSNVSTQARLFSTPGPTPVECTFQPTITPAAARLKGRSCYQMSQGDAERQEAQLKREREQKVKEEMKECTFQPKLGDGRYSSPNKSAIASDPERYSAWVRSRLEQREQQLEHERKEKREKEEKECTFAPKIHEAPGYIRTIAASVSLAKTPATREKAQHPCHSFGYAERGTFDGRCLGYIG